jgi:hypothetical protein
VGATSTVDLAPSDTAPTTSTPRSDTRSASEHSTPALSSASSQHVLRFVRSTSMSRSSIELNLGRARTEPRDPSEYDRLPLSRAHARPHRMWRIRAETKQDIQRRRRSQRRRPSHRAIVTTPRLSRTDLHAT